MPDYNYNNRINVRPELYKLSQHSRIEIESELNQTLNQIRAQAFELGRVSYKPVSDQYIHQIILENLSRQEAEVIKGEADLEVIRNNDLSTQKLLKSNRQKNKKKIQAKIEAVRAAKEKNKEIKFGQDTIKKKVKNEKIDCDNDDWTSQSNFQEPYNNDDNKDLHFVGYDSKENL